MVGEGEGEREEGGGERRGRGKRRGREERREGRRGREVRERGKEGKREEGTRRKILCPSPVNPPAVRASGPWQTEDGWSF